MKTRERIIYEALKLFSVYGYEAVSTRMIARATEVSDTAIYKHFKSKQEIFDTIIEVCKERFFTERKKADINSIQWDEVEQLCLDMFRFQITDEWIVMFRRVLVIEQFKSTEMMKLYKAFFIDIAVNSLTVLFTELMKEGYMKQCNPRVLAIELYAPFFMHHTLHDDSEKLLEELREHVVYFRENYSIDKCIKLQAGT